MLTSAGLSLTFWIAQVYETNQRDMLAYNEKGKPLGDASNDRNRLHIR